MRFHAVIVHVDVVAFLVGALGLGSLAGAFCVLNNIADLLERALDVVDIGEHLVDLAFARQTLNGGRASLLLLRGAAIGLGKVENCAGVGANLCGIVSNLYMGNRAVPTYSAEGLLVRPILVVSGGLFVSATGIRPRLAVGLGTGSIVVLVTGRDGVNGKRHLAGRHMGWLVRVRGGSVRLGVATRDGAVIVVNRAVGRAIMLARRCRSAIRHGRQARAAAERRSGRVGKGGNGVLPRGERGRVQRLRRVRVLVRVGVLTRGRSKRRRQTARAGLRRHAAVVRSILAGTSTRDDFGDGG